MSSSSELRKNYLHAWSQMRIPQENSSSLLHVCWNPTLYSDLGLHYSNKFHIYVLPMTSLSRDSLLSKTVDNFPVVLSLPYSVFPLETIRNYLSNLTCLPPLNCTELSRWNHVFSSPQKLQRTTQRGPTLQLPLVVLIAQFCLRVTTA